MTQEEIIQAISDDKMMPFIQPEQLAQIVAFVINNYKPSLPSDLDEAAEEYAEKHQSHDIYDCYGNPESDTIGKNLAFRAGAEWMAGQGISADAGVCKLTERAWVTPINEKQLQRDVHDNFISGEEVIIQIRKKH